MTTKNRLGETEDAVASADIGPNLCVKWHTVAGQITLCGVGDIPIGVSTDKIPSGKTGTFYRWGRGNSYYVVAASVAAGDYLKCAASGALVTEASATTPTLFTVGQAKTATDTAGNIEASSTR